MKKYIAGFIFGIMFTSSVAFAAQQITVFINGNQLKTEAKVISGQVFVPLRAVSEGLGVAVNWDGAKKQVKITDGSASNQPTTASANQVKGGNMLVNITKLERSQGAQFDTPKQGKEYLILHLTLKNTGKATMSYNPYDFKVKDSNGNITSSTFTTINNDTALNYGELAPNGTVSGTIAYEVPIGDIGLSMIYEYTYGKTVSTKIK